MPSGMPRRNKHRAANAPSNPQATLCTEPGANNDFPPALPARHDISRLPNELLHAITEYLEEGDVCPLTFTDRRLNSVASPILWSGL